MPPSVAQTDEGALSLPIRPRVEVIRDRGEVEAGMLGCARVLDQTRGSRSSLQSL
jgi:hypothetical protein